MADLQSLQWGAIRIKAPPCLQGLDQFTLGCPFPFPAYL